MSTPPFQLPNEGSATSTTLNGAVKTHAFQSQQALLHSHGHLLHWDALHGDHIRPSDRAFGRSLRSHRQDTDTGKVEMSPRNKKTLSSYFLNCLQSSRFLLPPDAVVGPDRYAHIFARGAERPTIASHRIAASPQHHVACAHRNDVLNVASDFLEPLSCAKRRWTHSPSIQITHFREVAHRPSAHL